MRSWIGMTGIRFERGTHSAIVGVAVAGSCCARVSPRHHPPPRKGEDAFSRLPLKGGVICVARPFCSRRSRRCSCRFKTGIATGITPHREKADAFSRLPLKGGVICVARSFCHPEGRSKPCPRTLERPCYSYHSPLEGESKKRPRFFGGGWALPSHRRGQRAFATPTTASSTSSRKRRRSLR